MERIFYIISVLAGLVFSIIVPARNLPQLSPDGAITRGKTPSGVSYYIVHNPVDKGYADIAVVRRSDAPGVEKYDGAASVAAFFARRGVGFRSEGMFSGYDGGTVYRFDRTPVSDLDSALLVSFEMISRSRADQAIILSGDMDPKAIRERMKIFSMLVPRLDVHTPGSGYVWENGPAPTARIDTTDIGQFRIEISAPRVPAPLMNTAQVLVNDIFARELLTIAGSRLERNLRKAGIPFASVRADHIGSDETSGDERYIIKVRTREELLPRALSVTGSTIEALKSSGAFIEEFRDVKKLLLAGMLRQGEKQLSNGEYVDKCISSFLFGGSLAPFREEVKLFAMKNVADTTELRLFNNFSRAILSEKGNVHIYYGSGDSTPQEVLDIFFNAEKVEETGAGFVFSSADTLGLPSRFPRVKIKDERPESLSGGTAWTFSNGMRVIYKRIRRSGMFKYAFYLGGGYGSVKGLREGEGGYYSALLNMFDTGGLAASDFRNMLASNGIVMRTNVTATGMDINGSAPYYKLPLLMRSLISLFAERTFNYREYDFFRECELIRRGGEDLDATLYKVLYPGFTLSPYPSPQVLDSLTASHSMDYFTERFNHCADGVLVLIGDLDETILRKQLCKTLGGFSTAKGSSTRRSVDRKPRSGKSVYMKDGPDKRVEMLITAEYPMTAVGYFSSLIASEKLHRALVSALLEEGVVADVSMNFSAYPEERLWCRLSITPALQEGLPEGIGPAEMTRVITRVRGVLSSLAATGVTDAELKTAKENLLVRFRAEGTADEAIERILMRYASGKNLLSGYAANISTITPAKVKDIFVSLDNGGRIEYIVR